MSTQQQLDATCGRLDALEKECPEVTAMMVNECNKEKSDMEADISRIQNEINKMERNDPKRIGELKSQISESIETINKVTDNIFILKQIILNKSPSLNEHQINSEFGIPEDLDLLE